MSLGKYEMGRNSLESFKTPGIWYRSHKAISRDRGVSLTVNMPNSLRLSQFFSQFVNQSLSCALFGVFFSIVYAPDEIRTNIDFSL